MDDCSNKVCPPECACRKKDQKISALRRRDPAWVSCAPSPAEVRAIFVKPTVDDRYHHIEVSCPFCGRYHSHNGGLIDKPMISKHKAFCGKGEYTILPPL